MTARRCSAPGTRPVTISRSLRRNTDRYWLSGSRSTRSTSCTSSEGVTRPKGTAGGTVAAASGAAIGVSTSDGTLDNGTRSKPRSSSDAMRSTPPSFRCRTRRTARESRRRTTRVDRVGSSGRDWACRAAVSRSRRPVTPGCAGHVIVRLSAAAVVAHARDA